MDSLLILCVAFGLASGAGGRACLAVLALGAFHHTAQFELAPSFAWIATPQVMAVLAVLGIVEILADAHPDVSELTELAAYLPKVVAGFLAFAATTGDVDSSLLQLGGSGLLGAMTAGTTHFLRNKVRASVRELAEATDEAVHKAASYAETGLFGALIGTTLAMPVLVPILLLALAGLGTFVHRKLKNRRVDCLHPDCEARLPVGATVCATCKRDQVRPTA
jgi:ribosomal protein L40E